MLFFIQYKKRKNIPKSISSTIMAFIFNTRDSLLFSRFIEIEHDDMVKEFERLKTLTSDKLINISDDNYDNLVVELVSESFNNFILYIIVKFDSVDDEIDMESLRIELHMRRRNITLDSHVYKSGEACKTWVDGLVKKYILCKCRNSLTKKDGYCKSCYPYVRTKKDNCCICLENEGVWVKLEKCGHKMHSYCWYKTEGLKCPLCRSDETAKYKCKTI